MSITLDLQKLEESLSNDQSKITLERDSETGISLKVYDTSGDNHESHFNIMLMAT